MYKFSLFVIFVLVLSVVQGISINERDTKIFDKSCVYQYRATLDNKFIDFKSGNGLNMNFKFSPSSSVLDISFSVELGQEATEFSVIALDKDGNETVFSLGTKECINVGMSVSTTAWTSDTTIGSSSGNTITTSSTGTGTTSSSSSTSGFTGIFTTNGGLFSTTN